MDRLRTRISGMPSNEKGDGMGLEDWPLESVHPRTRNLSGGTAKTPLVAALLCTGGRSAPNLASCYANFT